MARLGARVSVVAVLAATLVAGIGAGPAAADGASLTVTPRAISGGDHVQMAITGFVGGSPLGLFTCESADLPASGPLDVNALLAVCDLPAVPVSPPAVGGVITIDHVPAEAWFRAADGGQVLHRCGRRPDDCALVAWSVFDGATTPPVTITTTPRPLLVQPDTLSQPDPMTVLTAGTPGATLTLAQCVRPSLPSLDANACGNSVTATLDEDGLGVSTLVGAGAVDTPAGPVACVAGGTVGCAVASFDASGALLASHDVAVAIPPPLTVRIPLGADPLDGDALSVGVSGGGNIPVWVGECAASVVQTGDVDTGPCTDVQASSGTTSASTQNGVTATARLRFTGADGTPVDCGASALACVYAVESQDPADPSFATTPVTFDRPDVVTVAPTSGLLDGATVTVDAAGLRPQWAHAALVCKGMAPGQVVELRSAPCDQDTVGATTDAEGALSLQLPVHQRFTNGLDRYFTCREGCQAVVLRTEGGFGRVVSATPLAMAPGTMSVSPATGLVDGQAVTVTGGELMPSYDGPVLYLPTGGWALVQCDAAGADHPSLVDVLTRCGPVDQPGPLVVTGPDVARTVGVHTTVHRFLGGTTDCTGGAGACVLRLARWEQDATVTVLSVPLAFG